MKQLRITTIPEKTTRGVVIDFKNAVLAEHPHIQCSTLYWFGSTAVRFYVRSNKYGADFYKPHKFGFAITRVSTSGIRTHKGWVEKPLPSI